MYDESWCDSCGTSQPYSEDDVTCGSCVADTLEDFIARFVEDIDTLVKYDEVIHQVSVEYIED
jgi:hypothetical protein